MRLVRLALALLVLSYAPLLAVGLANPDANPIGLGLLALAGTVAACLLVAVAALRALAALLRR